MRIAIWVLLIAAVLVLIYSLAAVASKCSREEERDDANKRWNNNPNS